MNIKNVEMRYTAVATACGGRAGEVKTDDGVLDLKVSCPKEFGGEDNGYTNPEQLFAAGWAACFDNAVLTLAKARRAEITSSTTVEITLGLQEDKSYGLSAVIHTKIEGVDNAVAQRIVDAAHKICPYSKAVKGNIDIKIIVS